MVGLFGVDAPDVLLGGLAGLDVADGLDGSAHGVVLVVVTVLAVTTHAIEVAEGIQVLDQLVDVLIGVEIGRISLGNALAVGIKDVLLAVYHLHTGQFLDGQVRGFLIGQVPEVIAFVAEVFHANPDGAIRIVDQVGAPVVEDLEATDLVAGILHVNPVIGDDGRMAQSRYAGGVADAQLLDQETDGDEIAVRQAVGDLLHVFGGLDVGVVDGLDQILERHGGDEDVGVQGMLGTSLVLIDHGGDLAGFLVDLGHHGVDQHRDSLIGGLLLHYFPQLTGTELGIPEFLDQGGLHLGIVGLVLGHELEEGVLEHVHDAQAFDSLGAPIGFQSTLPLRGATAEMDK